MVLTMPGIDNRGADRGSTKGYAGLILKVVLKSLFIFKSYAFWADFYDYFS